MKHPPLPLPNGHRPAQRLVVEIDVIVRTRRSTGRIEISGLPALARSERADLVELGTIAALGMRIAVHPVLARVVVDEQDLTAWD